MVPSHTTRKKRKRYRYYVCSSAQKSGWSTCPTKSVPAGEMEAFVVERLRGIGRDKKLLQATLAQAREQYDGKMTELENDRKNLEQELRQRHVIIRNLANRLGTNGHDMVLARLAEVQGEIQKLEAQQTKVREEIDVHRDQRLDEERITHAFVDFDPLWESLTPVEQARVIHLMVEQVDYDGGQGKVTITFHPTGITTLLGAKPSDKKDGDGQ